MTHCISATIWNLRSPSRFTYSQMHGRGSRLDREWLLNSRSRHLLVFAPRFNVTSTMSLLFIGTETFTVPSDPLRNV